MALHVAPLPNGGAPVAPGTPVPNNVAIKSHLPLAIVSLLFSMIPGIVAVVYATKVSGLAAQGNLTGAQAAAKKAKIWAIVGICLGCVVITLQIVAAASTSI